MPPVVVIGGVECYSTSAAASVLNATPQTVRTLAHNSELSVVASPGDGRATMLVTVQSVDEFVRAHGHFPTAKNRKRVRSRLSAAQGVQDLTANHAHNEEQRSRKLEATIRSQSKTISHLLEALAAESRAEQKVDEAMSERRGATTHLRTALQELAMTVGLDGIPDDLRDVLD